MRKKILTAALASVMAITSAATASAVEKKDTISGDLTVTDFFGERTDAVELKSGESYTIEFNNKSNGTLNWHNFVLVIIGEIGEAYVDYQQEVLVIRADNWGWGGGYSDFVVPDAEGGNKLAFENNIDWDNWLAYTQKGCNVRIHIGREGDTLIYNANIGDYYVKLTATSGKKLPESLYVFLTGENCELKGIKSVKNATSTETEHKATAGNQAKPTAKPTGLGDLKVSEFFSKRTNTVQLKSGETCTLSFHNKSNGTNNHENFIMAIAGETGEAYTGAAQEVLVIRADNWGWGGGYSDFATPDAAGGNKLVFDTNIDWDKWVAFSQAGFDVNITLTRTGDTITYNAAMGNYYVKLTATSGKALPDTLYVFLTGENCELTGIKAASSSKSTVNASVVILVAAAVLTIIYVAVAVWKKKPK